MCNTEDVLEKIKFKKRNSFWEELTGKNIKNMNFYASYKKLEKFAFNFDIYICICIDILPRHFYMMFI